MKICPQCDATYHDDELSFCLMDGATLVPGDTVPTVMMTAEQETIVAGKRRGPAFWVGVTIAAIAALGGAAIGGAFLYVLFTQDNSVSNRNGGVIASPTPQNRTPKATSSPSPSPVAAISPSVTPVSTKNVQDEVVPIAWDTMANSFKHDPGLMYTFKCPENGTEQAVWGSDVYAGMSSICTAAVHAGLITLESGGELTIEFRPGRSIYGTTKRNGITTSTFGENDISFVFRKAGN